MQLFATFFNPSKASWRLPASEGNPWAAHLSDIPLYGPVSQR
jgi:hypothetical protein